MAKCITELVTYPTIEILYDPNYLPSHQDIIEIFKVGDYTEKLTRWEGFFYGEQHPVFELINQEFIEALSDYLIKRTEELGATDEKPLTILEIGAGDGRLTHFLMKRCEQQRGLTKFIATDSGEWGLQADFPVEIMDHRKALQKYQPDIVIFSWMPYKYDCTDDIRACPSVKEYLLIGEMKRGCCGDPWLTWGDSSETEPMEWYFEDKEAYEQALREHNQKYREAPYERDGFKMENLLDIGAYQICRTDEPDIFFHSNTVSFKRSKADTDILS